MIANHTVRRAIRKVLESTTLDIEKLTREVCPSLDIHRSIGKSYGIQFTKMQKAQAISELLGDTEVYWLAARLLNISSDDGYYYGTSHRVRHLRDLRNAIKTTQNLEYDVKRRKWVQTRTRNYELAVLQIDIVNSSGLVENYPVTEVEKAYRYVKNMTGSIGQDREGTIHKWEGDGGLLVFFPNNRNACENPTLCGMEIIHNLFFYNLVENTMGEDLRVRIAVDCGPCCYHEDIHELHGDVLADVIRLEKITRPNTMTVSQRMYNRLGVKIQSYFQPADQSQDCFIYNIEWEWTS